MEKSKFEQLNVLRESIRVAHKTIKEARAKGDKETITAAKAALRQAWHERDVIFGIRETPDSPRKDEIGPDGKPCKRSKTLKDLVDPVILAAARGAKAPKAPKTKEEVDAAIKAAIDEEAARSAAVAALPAGEVVGTFKDGQFVGATDEGKEMEATINSAGNPAPTTEETVAKPQTLRSRCLDLLAQGNAVTPAQMAALLGDGTDTKKVADVLGKAAKAGECRKENDNGVVRYHAV